MNIAEVSFADLEALAGKVRSQLAGDAVWADRKDYEARDGMRRALRGAGKHKQHLAQLVTAHLTDEDVVVRTGAVAVVGDVAAILGADAVATIAERNEELFDGVAPQGHTIDQPDLWWEILVAIGRSIRTKDRRAIGLYRTNAGATRGYWLLGVLAKCDTDWLVDHAAAVVPPDMIPGLLNDVAGENRRARLVRHMPWSAKTAADALAGPWSDLPFDDREIAELRQLIRDGGAT